MTPAVPDIDFRQVRPHGSPAARSGGFEEVASLVIKDGIPGLIDWPEGTTFRRFGNPDGGREGTGILENGDVWAWQAKYLFALGDSEIAQVRKSVVRALETEPNLKRYFIALPYDLPAGDTVQNGRPVKSAATRWQEKKEEWEKLAKDKGNEVEFLYVGASELSDQLTRVENAGRVRYWFGAAAMSANEQQHRLDDVISKVGRRYAPELHIEVDAVRALEGLGRSDAYVHRIQLALASLRSARSATWRAPADDSDLQVHLDTCVERLTGAEVALGEFLDVARGTGPLPGIADQIEAVEPELDTVSTRLRTDYLRDGGYYVGAAASVHSNVLKAEEATWAALELLRSADTVAAERGLLLMTGRAGVGKTHLFCDVASRRLAQGYPTLVLLGQDFDEGTLLPQIGKLTQIDGHLDEILKLLDAAAEAAGCSAMLMVDAINEGAKAGRWNTELRALARAVDRYPNVVLAVSCRTEFVEAVVGENELPRVEHLGFAEATPEAVDRYVAEYGLKSVTFPVLNPEFGNALFLKLACEALSTLGETRFTLGTVGLTTVCDAFLVAVNERLAVPDRCDYDSTSHLVRVVARELAALGPGPYERNQIKQIVDGALPDRGWSKSLFAGMLREGLLLETRDNHVVFTYQRLCDVLRAELLAEKSVAELAAWYEALEAGSHWYENGVIGALAVLAPDKLGVEVVDLFSDGEGAVEWPVVDAFLEGLALRSPENTTDRTAEIVSNLIAYGGLEVKAWEALLRVACVPDHRTNADCLHRFLLNRPLAQRDKTWSEWLVGAYDISIDHPVKVLLNWARPKSPGSDRLPDELARLSGLTIGWLLTTTDRRVRDHATRALVAVGERNLSGLASAVQAFRGCDDPYVVERLAAAACSVALRSNDADTITVVADAAADLVADGMPVHLATRDYLRRIADAAKAHGWSGPDWTPPYGSVWPVECLPHEQVKEMTGAPDYAYSSILRSLTGITGDFGRYVVKPAIEHFDVPNYEDVEREAERAIFSRVVDFGWTPERFANLDGGRRGGHEGYIERYGKKYQWIALHELLGRLADNYQLTDRWDDAALPFDYYSLDQVLYHDIDPTVIIYRETTDPDKPLPWFAPAAATFPAEITEDYPSDIDGVPDPLDLIALTDYDGTHWLSLVRYANWAQELPPEIAAFNPPNLSIWMQVRSYIVRIEDLDSLKSWAAEGGGQDYDGRWMPEHAELYNCHLANHPFSAEWNRASGEAEPRYGAVPIPVTLYVPNAEYNGTGSSHDTTDISGHVPSRLLFEVLKLDHGKDFTWTDVIGPAVVDPTAGTNASSTLVLRRDLVDRLADRGYSLFWTVLLNKQLEKHDPDDMYRWVSASASYILNDTTIELVAAVATRRSPASAGESQAIAWNPRESE
ncbi:hypothetical protein [Prauserella alba]|uniref:ATP-binding protein n=1 Tax=Prauserella alba TaxID=176898 RepID=A0ABP4FLF5_9PSEU|nr:hypothetical protein [Prauserella alba]MCP2178863.1 hypothetical protein [Prauserella alba]